MLLVRIFVKNIFFKMEASEKIVALKAVCFITMSYYIFEVKNLNYLPQLQSLLLWFINDIHNIKELTFLRKVFKMTVSKNKPKYSGFQ